jgi:hypothetical protein
VRQASAGGHDPPRSRDSRAADGVGYSFLVMLANDGGVDLDELHFLERLALADGEIDDDEREALRGILARVEVTRLAPAVQTELAEFRRRYAV